MLVVVLDQLIWVVQQELAVVEVEEILMLMEQLILVVEAEEDQNKTIITPILERLVALVSSSFATLYKRTSKCLAN
jgi:hypothetical protein